MFLKDISTYITTCAEEISKEVQKKSVTRISDSYKNNLDKTSSNENLSSDKKFTNGVYQSTKPISVQERIERLQRYGEPSSLSPIVLNNSSKRVFLEFQSPVRPTDRDQTKTRKMLNKNFTGNSR